MKVSVGEKILREILDEIIVNKNVLFNYRGINGLINVETGHPLELDIYYPDLNLAFEFQGEQHYKETNFADNKLVEQIKKRDKIKEDKCKELGVTLITINGMDLGMSERHKIRQLRPDIEQTKPTRQQTLTLMGKGKGYRTYMNKMFPNITSTKTDVRVWRENMKKQGIEIPKVLRRKTNIPMYVREIVESGKYEEWKIEIAKKMKRHRHDRYLPKELQKEVYYIFESTFEFEEFLGREKTNRKIYRRNGNE